jgi:hypothetical protein
MKKRPLFASFCNLAVYVLNVLFTCSAYICTVCYF